MSHTSVADSGDGGGGGGGFYGGGGGASYGSTSSHFGGGGGGGGSSFAYFTATGVSMTQGTRAGNGEVVITWDVPCQPPLITSVSASPNVLWPPNHRMLPVTVSVTRKQRALRREMKRHLQSIGSGITFDE